MHLGILIFPEIMHKFIRESFRRLKEAPSAVIRVECIIPNPKCPIKNPKISPLLLRKSKCIRNNGFEIKEIIILITEYDTHYRADSFGEDICFWSLKNSAYLLGFF